MRLLPHHAEAGALVDRAGAGEDALRPQRDAAVAGRAREADALVHQTPADAQAARLRLDQQQAQLCDVLAALDQKHGADAGAVQLGDPALFARGIELAQELSHDLGGQRLECSAPAVFFSVTGRVPLQHPAHVAGAVRAVQDRGRARGVRRQAPLDRLHGRDNLLLARLRHGLQQRADQLFRAVIELAERGAAFGAEREQRLPSVFGRGLADDQVRLGESSKQPAQIAVVEAEGGRDRRRRRLLGLPQFIEHARLGQGEAGVDHAVPQQPDLPGVEAVEPADGVDALGELRRGHAGKARAIIM